VDTADEDNTEPESAPKRRVSNTALIVAAALIGGLILGALTGFGGFGDQGLEVGDCFELPTAGVFDDVTDQSCDGLHETEILAVINLDADTPWPGVGLLEGGGDAALACESAIGDLQLRDENIPDDAKIGVLHADEANWESSGREVICYTFSSVGFAGPVVNR